MKNILVIRRDNIGDMVCTTPLLQGIKTAFPDVKLTLLVNNVAKDVVINNPHVDALHVYKKSKHRLRHESAMSVYWQRLKIFITLRRTHFDAVVLANPMPCRYSLRLARLAGAKNIIGVETLARDDVKNALISRGDHQVEHTFSYLSALTSVHLPVPDVQVYLTENEKALATQRVSAFFPDSSCLYGIHISSRSPKRRWPIESYARFISKLLLRKEAQVLLFWSPQGTLGPDDPGDDARVTALLSQFSADRVAAYPTASIRELMAGFHCCKQIMCSDGGQMHIAAALHKKQVVFFGDTNATHWHPWSGEYEILQTASGECMDISVDQAWLAWQRLKSR